MGRKRAKDDRERVLPSSCKRWTADSRLLKFLWLSALLFSCSGASCFHWTRGRVENSPVMFETVPELGEVIQKINYNTSLIQQLESDNVRITAAGVPTLRAKLAIQRPRNLRLRADLLMSRELDIGSNEEVFWMFSKTGTGALLFSTHEEFARSQAQQILPINPQWLLDALGLVTFDPSAQHVGPFDHGPEEMEIQSQLITPGGEHVTKSTIIHRTYGWIVEQQVRDSSGRIIAVARAKQHRYYAEVGATLPGVVDVQLAPGQPNQMAFQVDVGVYRLNQQALPLDSFVMPMVEGYPHINLADPRSYQQFQPASRPSAYQSYSPADRTGYRQQYRGYSR